MTTARGTGHGAQGTEPGARPGHAVRRALSAVPDPLLQADLARILRPLIDAHGKAAVTRACETVLKRHVVEASDPQRARIATIIDQLKGCFPKDQIMRLLMLHKNRGIPVETSLEVLDRVVAIRPAKPWALINTVMHVDYPHWS